MNENQCETVEVLSPKSPCGFIVINASDYDPKVHTKHEAEPQEKTAIKRGKK